MVGWKSWRDEICLPCPRSGPYQRKGSTRLPTAGLLPNAGAQTRGQLERNIPDAETSDSVQPMKPQPPCLQRRTCPSQPVKVDSRLNGLLLIWLLPLSPPQPVPGCIFTQPYAPQHILPGDLPKQGPWKYLKIVLQILLSQLPSAGEELCCAQASPRQAREVELSWQVS